MVGHTLVELLVALTVTLLVFAAAVTVALPATAGFSIVPEHTDVQQRLRAVAETLRGDILAAWAGPVAGGDAGADVWWPPAIPCGWGGHPATGHAGPCADARALAVVRPSRTFWRHTAADSPDASGWVVLLRPPGCPPGDAGCEFAPGDEAMLADGAGAAEPLSVASDSPDTVLPSVALAGAYAAGSILASAAVRTYYAVDVPATSSLQLRRRDGETDVPVLDDVAAFEVSYFGAPAPPALTVDASGQPHVTYGPAPVTAADGSVVPSCAFEVNDGHVASRLEARPGLADGLAALPLTAFLDGPWCPDATSSWRWDLDLARIRRLRLTVRTQASSAWLRGRDAAWFTRPGRARHAGRLVPDAGITFDVALRGLAR